MGGAASSASEREERGTEYSNEGAWDGAARCCTLGLSQADLGLRALGGRWYGLAQSPIDRCALAVPTLTRPSRNSYHTLSIAELNRPLHPTDWDAYKTRLPSETLGGASWPANHLFLLQTFLLLSPRFASSRLTGLAKAQTTTVRCFVRLRYLPRARIRVIADCITKNRTTALRGCASRSDQDGSAGKRRRWHGLYQPDAHEPTAADIWGIHFRWLANSTTITRPDVRGPE